MMSCAIKFTKFNCRTNSNLFYMIKDFSYCENTISSHVKINLKSSCEDNNDVICAIKFTKFNCQMNPNLFYMIKDFSYCENMISSHVKINLKFSREDNNECHMCYQVYQVYMIKTPSEIARKYSKYYFDLLTSYPN